MAPLNISIKIRLSFIQILLMSNNIGKCKRIRITTGHNFTSVAILPAIKATTLK